MRRATATPPLCAILLVALAAPPALALSPGVAQHLTAARMLLEDLEYERALEQVQFAKPLVRDLDDNVSVSLLEGVLLSEMGKGPAAEGAFRAALLLKPEAQLPVAVSPKTRASFEGIRAQVRDELAHEAAPPPVVVSTAAPSRPSPAVHHVAWLPLAAGGAVLAGGAFCLTRAFHMRDLLHPSSPIPISDASRDASQGKTFQTLGYVGLGVGSAAVLGGLLMSLWPQTPDRPVTARVELAPGRAAMVFSAELP